MDRNQTVHASARVCTGPRETTDPGIAEVRTPVRERTG